MIEFTDTINRRLVFLANEIKAGGNYDLSVVSTLRCLSNHASIGKDGSSAAIKKANPRMSSAARRLREELSNDKIWFSKTINEHPFPLKKMWDAWIRENQTISEAKIWDDLCAHPMITITKQEDVQLRAVDKRRVLPPKERYEQAGILIVTG